MNKNILVFVPLAIAAGFCAFGPTGSDLIAAWNKDQTNIPAQAAADALASTDKTGSSSRELPIDVLCKEGVGVGDVAQFVEYVGQYHDYVFPKKAVVLGRKVGSKNEENPDYVIKTYDPASNIEWTSGWGKNALLGRSGEFGVVFAGETDEETVWWQIVQDYKKNNGGKNPKPSEIIALAKKNSLIDNGYAALLVQDYYRCDFSNRPKVKDEYLIYPKSLIVASLTVRDVDSGRTAAFTNEIISFSKEPLPDGSTLISGNVAQKGDAYFLIGVDEKGETHSFRLGLNNKSKLVWKFEK